MPGFEKQLAAELKELVANFKEFAFRAKYKNVMMVDPAISMRHMTREEVWGKDPVHPEKAAYKKVADGVVWLADKQSQTSIKRQRSNTADGSDGGGNRGRKVVFRESSLAGSSRGNDEGGSSNYISGGGGGGRGRSARGSGRRGA
jgi:hypothetical protein